jgi:hypothetical protein
MSGKNRWFRTAAAGFVVLFSLTVGGAQEAALQRTPAMGLFERMIPSSLRLWFPERQATHRRALPLKCAGGTIEPNGTPCPHAACAGCG